MTTSNAELICRGYDAFGRGDVATVLAILDANITWHVPGHSPLSGDYKGHDEVAGFFTETMRLSAGTFTIKIVDVLASNDRVVVLCTVAAERKGQSWSSSEVHLWRVVNELAIEFCEYQGDQQTEDEFWSA
jgi:ketosteroid isomerase-like protein